MADNITAPGAGAVLATDDIGGVQYPRSKVVFGGDGTATDASSDNPLPTLIDRTDNLLAMLSRVVKLLESNAVVDQQQRQRITLDSISTGLALNTVNNVGTVTTVNTVNTVVGVTTVGAQTTLAGMDREMYINAAKQTYALSIRSRLEFI